MKRSQKEAAKLSWVTMKMVFPICFFASAKASITARPDLESRLPVGSSARIMSGRLIMLRATAALCFSPPDICAGYLFMICPIPNISANCSTSCPASSSTFPCMIRGIRIFSRIVSPSKREKDRRDMLRIAICDGEVKARDALRIQLEKILIEESEEIVYEFSSGMNGVSWLGKHPGEIDLLFLDVEMKGLNGMETAEKIRELDGNLYIVFVTGYDDYVFERYRVGALDYLLKPVSLEKLYGVLVHIRKKVMQEENNSFTLRNIDGIWRFRLSDILYFYSDRRKVFLVTKNGEYPFYARLNDIEKQLEPHFVRIHQRYLVNPEEVDYLNGESVMLGDRKLPCSRKYKETAMGKIARAMMGAASYADGMFYPC